MNSGTNNNLDEDILQAKADLLKVKNVVPPFGKPPAGLQEAPKATVEPQNIIPAPVLEPQPISEDEPAEDNFDGEEEEGCSGGLETDSDLESRILASLEASPDALASTPPAPAAPQPQSCIEEEEDEDEPQSWIQMIKKQAATSTAVTGTDVPKFNLAEQIMAQQRKSVSDRRKGPGQSPRPIVAIPAVKSSPAPTFKDPFVPIIRPRPSGPADKILAQIVARDIQKFLKPA